MYRMVSTASKDYTGIRCHRNRWLDHRLLCLYVYNSSMTVYGDNTVIDYGQLRMQAFHTACELIQSLSSPQSLSGISFHSFQLCK